MRGNGKEMAIIKREFLNFSASSALKECCQDRCLNSDKNLETLKKEEKGMKELKITLVLGGILAIVTISLSSQVANAVFLGESYSYMMDATSDGLPMEFASDETDEEILTIPEGAVGIIDFEQVEGEGRVGSIGPDALEAYPNIYGITTGWGNRTIA